MSRYLAGQEVVALDRSHRWRRAYVERPEPYLKAKTDGARIMWADLPPVAERDGSESAGGWHSESTLVVGWRDEGEVALAHMGFVLYCVGDWIARHAARAMRAAG